MERSRRRILLAVQPAVLEGALARMILAESGDEVVQAGRVPDGSYHGGYDAAVVSAGLPSGVRADVVVMLPDTRGSAGLGTITCGGVVHEVSIPGAERVVQLLNEYMPRP
jgi:hypothetical protein